MSSHPLAFLRLPNSLLMALDSRAYHFWFQPVHYLARIVHILTMAAFFGLEFLFILAVIQNLDRPTVVRISRFMVKPLHISYALAMISGFALFFYDPMHIAIGRTFLLSLSHWWWRVFWRGLGTNLFTGRLWPGGIMSCQNGQRRFAWHPVWYGPLLLCFLA